MATKKKSKKKAKRKVAGKKAVPQKKSLKKKAAPKNKSSGKKAAQEKKRIRGKSESFDSVVFKPKGLGARSGGQSGDLQGLSGLEGADSESVGELLEARFAPARIEIFRNNPILSL